MNDGKFIHETVYTEQNPTYLNFIEGKSGVQFVHRTLAYIVVLLIITIWYKAKNTKTTSLQAMGIKGLIIIVAVQFFLGILTLILAVPVWLGVLHQVAAFVLLSFMIFTLHRFSK